MSFHHSRRASLLTDHQQQIVELIARGWTNRRIAAKLGASMGTLRWQLKDMHRRLGQRVRLQKPSVDAPNLELAGAGAFEKTNRITDQAGGPQQNYTTAVIPPRGGADSSASEDSHAALVGGSSAVSNEEVVPPKESLTPHEKEILSQFMNGMLCKEIANRMNLSLYTVQNTLRRIRRKTGVFKTRAARA